MDNRKIIITTYLAITALVSWLTYQLWLGFSSWANLSRWVTRNLGAHISPQNFTHAASLVIPLGTGLLTLFFMGRSKRLGTFADEVVIELKKVTWPSREDVVKSTIVVLGCVLFASLVLAAFDISFGKIVSWLLPKPPNAVEQG